MLHPAENALLPYTVVISTLIRVRFSLNQFNDAPRHGILSAYLFIRTEITTVYPKLRCTI